MASALSVREGVELFHLLFLAELGTKLDRSLYSIKGGCNLRFFFGSVRFSEDLDIDIRTTGKDTLRRKVDRLIASRSLKLTLGAHGIVITSSSRPKQTDTTQRWKLSLTIQDVPAHTKIEFSRPGLDRGVDFDPVDAAILNRYRIIRTLVSHYGIETAFKQKLHALVGRTETQARDVFDLELLLSRSRSNFDIKKLDSALIDQAIERALELEYNSFRSQVVAFLLPEHQRQFETAEVWERMVLRLVDALADGQER